MSWAPFRKCLAVSAGIALLLALRLAAEEVNIAPLVGKATQSTTSNNADASRAIDGNTNGDFNAGSVTHTGPSDPTPWWEVNLGNPYTLLRIVLWNRTGCCPERLSNFRVSVLDAARFEVWGQDFFTDLTFPNPSSEISLPGGTTGQIVRIALLGPNTAGTMILSLAEVQVFADSTGILAITKQPSSARVYAGPAFALSVGLLDTNGVTFQWKKDNDPVPGGTGQTLVFCKLRAADTGTYTVTATRNAESVTSDPAKLEVIANNLAPFGLATQSSTHSFGDASRAIDRNSDGNYLAGSVTHTSLDSLADPSPWWEVQLVGPSTIEKIILWNRTECCPERLSNFRVSVLGAARAEVWGADFFTDLTFPNPSLEITLPGGTTGQIVRIALLGPSAAGTMILSLAEVEVYGSGPAPLPDPNLARGRPTAQSSLLNGYVSALAVDGDLNDFTHTDAADAAPWWEVDLCEMSDIETIVLHNRTSCCGSRLRDITVEILDSARISVFTSKLLNRENELGAFPNGPPELTLDLVALEGHVVRGQFVSVTRTPDPDLSGTGGQGNAGEANSLSLAEVEALAPLNCPTQGDTHCTGLTVEGPAGGGPGTYTLTASATDDSGQILLYHAFTLDDGVRPPIVTGLSRASSLTLPLHVGTWNVKVEVTDEPRCPDKAPEATCSRVIDVIGDPNNLALKGTATQSTTAGDRVAFLAIDGLTDGNHSHGSVTHTSGNQTEDPTPWWKVDLGGMFPLSRIVLWNRTDCCSSRLSNFRVSVLDGADGEVWGQDFFIDGVGYPDPALGGFEIPLPGGTTGQVVKVAILGPNAGKEAVLSLAEVQVFGSAPSGIGPFIRGDCNGDGAVTGQVTDAVFLLNYNFLGGPAPPCSAACDINGDGAWTGQVTDAVYILNYNFLGGPSPPAPFPGCGLSTLESDKALGCATPTTSC